MKPLSTMISLRLCFQLMMCALMVIVPNTNGLLITSARLGVGPERGLLLLTLDDGTRGSACVLNDSKVGEAVCSFLLGSANATAVSVGLFPGASTQPVVAAISGCPGYDPSQTGRWNLNNDCRVITGPAIPALCNQRRLQVACELVELRHGNATSSEGLVLTGLAGRLGTVCATGTGVNEAAAVCRSLGYGAPQRAYPVVGRYRPNLSDPNENATVQQLSCGPSDRLFNCSWQSALSPECFDPRNQLAVACNPDGRPTPRPWPSPSLVCYRQEARVCFSLSSVDSANDLELLYNATATSGCLVENFTVGPELCLIVRDYSSCAQQSDITPSYIQYLLLVRYAGKFDQNGNSISPPLSFYMHCRISSETLATGNSLAPDFTTPTSSSDGHSGGHSVVEIYRGLEGGSLTGGPVSGPVEVGVTLYAAVLLRGTTDSNSFLVVNSCWATNGRENATLVENKCPKQADIVLIPINATAMAVRFAAFLFNSSSSGAPSQMQLLCRTVSCRVGDPSVQCSRQCVNFYSGRIEPRDRPSWQIRVSEAASLTVYRPGNSAPPKVRSFSASTLVLTALLTAVLR